jgi:hypothetical protein
MGADFNDTEAPVSMQGIFHLLLTEASGGLVLIVEMLYGKDPYHRK